MVLQHVSSTETSHKESWLKEAQRIESLEDHPGSGGATRKCWGGPERLLIFFSKENIKKINKKQKL
jgi:hypothetical protein